MLILLPFSELIELGDWFVERGGTVILSFGNCVGE